MTEKVSMGGVAWRIPFPPVEGFHGADVLTLHTVAAQSLRAPSRSKYFLIVNQEGTETDTGCTRDAESQLSRPHPVHGDAVSSAAAGV